MDHPLSIDALLNACLQGNPLAWETLVRQYQNRVYSTCYLYLRNAHDAEELAQDTFVQVYRNLPKYGGSGEEFYPWLITIARNGCIDRVRYNKARLPQHQSSDDEEPVESEDQTMAPDRALSAAHDHAIIYQALQQSDAQTRDLIVLKEIQGFALEEVATILGIPVGTVKSKCHRAKLALARIIRRANPLYGVENSND
jgi:RNA polymerase sigma-70 factor, ECF subfamily